MHGRIGNPSCEYISTRPILNRNKNIPICMCYDRSFRVSILLATSCYHGGPSQSIRHQSKVATSRNMLINMLLHSLQPPKCSLKTMHKQRSLIFSQAVSIFWFCFALRYSASFWEKLSSTGFFYTVIKTITRQTFILKRN